MIGAPGTGKTTSLLHLGRYIFDNLDKLMAKLAAQLGTSRDIPPLRNMRERIKKSLDPDCYLSFTFSNHGQLPSFAQTLIALPSDGIFGLLWHDKLVLLLFSSSWPPSMTRRCIGACNFQTNYMQGCPSFSHKKTLPARAASWQRGCCVPWWVRSNLSHTRPSCSRWTIAFSDRCWHGI